MTLESSPTMWRRQFIVLASFALVAVPVALLDRWLLDPSGIDTHFLDFRGLLIEAYLTWLLVQSLLTTAVVAILRPKRLVLVHVAGAVLSAVAILCGSQLLTALGDREQAKAAQKQEQDALSFSKAFALERWSIAGSSEPKEISVELVIEASGELAMVVTGLTARGSSGVQGDVERLPVAGGQRLRLRIPLERRTQGEVASWQMQLMFYRPPVGAPEASRSEWDGISVIYEPASPRLVYDGRYVYRALPPPSAPAR
jgi:hypothetical protein